MGKPYKVYFCKDILFNKQSNWLLVETDFAFGVGCKCSGSQMTFWQVVSELVANKTGYGKQQCGNPGNYETRASLFGSYPYK